MSISGALSNAMQGLRAAGLGSEIVAANLSNALTPGYGVRALALSSDTNSTHGGVRIDGVRRVVTEAVINDKRLAEADKANQNALNDLYTTIEGLIGTPENPASLSAQITNLEMSFITAASRPDATERLGAAVASAKTLANTFVSAADRLNSVRTNADSMISAQVDQLNTALKQVERLNIQITKLEASGNSIAALMDQRQQIIDDISVLVPVRSIARENSQVALFSTGGAILLDHTAANIEFTRSHIITPSRTFEDGDLDGIKINGVDMRTNSSGGALSGGAIGAQFTIRDEIAVDAQTQIDALARDMIERFQNPAINPSAAPGQAGLFTDAGGVFTAADEVGISGRMKVNAAVDPGQNGETWRLRDGLAATTPGDVSDGAILNAMISALSEPRVIQSGAFNASPYDAINLTSALASHFGFQRTASEQSLSFSSAQVDELTERLLSEGVDSDEELQRLLIIEQTYAANARMIQVVDEMMQTLLRI